MFEYQSDFVNLSSTTSTTANIFRGEGFLNSITINSNNGGVISLGNGTSTVIGNLQHSSITLAATDREFNFHGERFKDGCIVNLTGTCSITARYSTNLGTRTANQFVSPITVKGGVVNGDFALQPSFVAATNVSGRWIDGTANGSTTNENYNWGFSTITPSTGSNAYFDTVGGYKCITVDAQGLAKAGANASRCEVNTTLGYHNSTIPISYQHKLIPVLPSTTYKISGEVWITSCSDTTNIATQIVATGYAADAITRTTSVGSDALYGTTLGQYIPVSKTFNTGSTTYYIILSFGCFLFGVDGTDRAMKASCKNFKFTQTTSLTNPGSFNANYYPSSTVVTSTDNIDQSQILTGGAVGLGDNVIGGHVKVGQKFTPTKKPQTGVVVRRSTSVGSPTGDVTISIQADVAGSPSGTDLVAKTIPNATWLGITLDTDYSVVFPSTLNITVGNSYWYVYSSSTQDNSNYTQLVRDSGSTTGRKNYDGTNWNTATGALYFKELYSKNTDSVTVATDTQSTTMTAPTTDGWANGTVINFTNPITLAPGSNNIYVSSNGPATADGTVDPSLQATVSGTITI